MEKRKWDKLHVMSMITVTEIGSSKRNWRVISAYKPCCRGEHRVVILCKSCSETEQRMASDLTDRPFTVTSLCSIVPVRKARKRETAMSNAPNELVVVRSFKFETLRAVSYSADLHCLRLKRHSETVGCLCYVQHTSDVPQRINTYTKSHSVCFMPEMDYVLQLREIFER